MAPPPQQEPVPPLALSTVKKRYPRLFREYTHLSERDREIAEDIGSDDDSPPSIDPATGLSTKIMFENFAEPLEDNAGCPMITSSDGNKFAMFLWKLLSASESGSIGGDACRQYDILKQALNDIMSISKLYDRFEHLLGWTSAVVMHGMHALLYRGDPDRNRSLFKAVGDDWKKVFEMTSGEMGVSDELRKFAIYMCESLRELLKQAKKEYGEHAKYTFNFMKKGNASKPKGPSASSSSSSATIAAANNAGVQSTSPTSVTAVAYRPSTTFKLGLGIAQEKGKRGIKITSISPESPFAKTGLKVGMTINTIDGKNYASFSEGFQLLKASEGRVTIVASPPGGTATPRAASSATPAAPSVSSVATVTPAVARANHPVTGNQKENSAPAKNNSSSGSETDNDEQKPWERDGWVPMRGSKQKSPNMIRSELQKYIDECKAAGTMTQTRIIEKMGVNNNTFRRFMNPKTYKDQWSATQNGTYWAAAKLLAEVKYQNEKRGIKRKCSSSSDSDNGNSSKISKAEATAFLDRINAVEDVTDDDAVFDSCPQIVVKIKAFLQRDGMTKTHLLRALGNLNSNSMNRFLMGKGQDQCSNVTYKAAYVFFEKLRILEGQEKSSARLKNEAEHPNGFSLTKSRGGFWISPHF